MPEIGGAAALLKAGDAAAALQALQVEVRADPADAALRVFLFQLLALHGQWQRALNQLNVAAELDTSVLSIAQLYRDALASEPVRAQVFAGATTPRVLGQPQQWVALLAESLRAGGAGDVRQAARWREQAFDEAPASSGTLDGQPFDWIADADSRLGPVLEAVVNGHYCWISFASLRRVEMQAPRDLRDLVWTPARLELDDGSEATALIPSRYPQSEASEDAAIVMARKTIWTEAAGGVYHGLGQRILATNAGDTALLDVRSILLTQAASA